MYELFHNLHITSFSQIYPIEVCYRFSHCHTVCSSNDCCVSELSTLYDGGLDILQCVEMALSKT
jgi:hypothetical protein